MVSGLTHRYKINIPAPPSRPDSNNTCVGGMVPAAVPRLAVRSILASTCCSIKQLMAKAAAANNQIPTVAQATLDRSGKPGVARNIPITAQKTANWVTRGLVSTQYWRNKPRLLSLAVVDVMTAFVLSESTLYRAEPAWSLSQSQGLLPRRYA